MKEVISIELDISEKYHYFDKEETKWEFSYQTVAGVKGWYVWMTRPGQPAFCAGLVTEDEIEERIMDNPPLTQDDLIDLELWMNSGGLDVKPKGK